MEFRPDRTTLLLFFGSALLAAGNFVAVRYSNQELAPFWGAGLRFALAAASFAALVLVTGAKWVRREDVPRALLAGLLNFAVFYALMYWSLVRVTAGTASVMIGTVPLLTLLLAASQRLERLSARTFLGGVLALAGIGWMTAASGVITAEPLALLTLFLAAACLAQAIIVVKRVSRNNPAALNALGMGVGAAVLLLLSLFAGETWNLPTSTPAILAVVYLVTFGSMGLFGLTILLLRRWSSSASAYVLVVAPLFTLVLEAMIAGAPLTVSAVLGAVLVVAGTWFGALRRGQAAPTPPRTPPAAS